MTKDQLLFEVVALTKQAGREIMQLYEAENDYKIQYKDDSSPVTIADKVAHELICRYLAKLTPKIPVLSEESLVADPADRLTSERIWLVDPLDGTKEFINRNGEFTVNLALIDKGVPTIGVVYSPVLELMYFAAQNFGAWRQANEDSASKIYTKNHDGGRIRLAVSRSHPGKEIENFRAFLETQTGLEVECISMGSSLKICLVAEGRIDIYPRLGPTSEWDTAAAHCILNEAGGAMVDIDHNHLVYNKTEILNPWFFAIGDPTQNWLKLYNKRKV